MTYWQIALTVTGVVVTALGSLWYWGAKFLRELDGLGVDWDFETMFDESANPDRVD